MASDGARWRGVARGRLAFPRREFSPCRWCTRCRCSGRGGEGWITPGTPFRIARLFSAARPSDGYLFSVLILSKKKGRLAGEGVQEGTPLSKHVHLPHDPPWQGWIDQSHTFAHVLVSRIDCDAQQSDSPGRVVHMVQWFGKGVGGLAPPCFRIPRTPGHGTRGREPFKPGTCRRGSSVGKG